MKSPAKIENLEGGSQTCLWDRGHGGVIGGPCEDHFEDHLAESP
jgi:hypothetical protein